MARRKAECLTERQMVLFIWKALEWKGKPPATLQQLWDQYAPELQMCCPVPGGWLNMGVETTLIKARSTLWTNDQDDTELWEALHRSAKGRSSTLLVCDPGLVSHNGLHVVCKRPDEEFQQWLEQHREATMIINPVPHSHDMLWCSRLVDMLNRDDEQ